MAKTILEALEVERGFYLARGLDDRAAEVEAQIVALGGAVAKKAAPVEAAAAPRVTRRGGQS